MNLPILDWASQNPYLAFFLAWPVALALVSTVYLFAATTENAMNLILRLTNQATNMVVILVRGYAPTLPEVIIPTKDDTDAAP